MCIIADNVNDVSKTKIASFHIGYIINNNNIVVPGQLVIYSAAVDSTVATNALILPVYNPGNNPDKIIPLDLSHLPNLFDDIDNVYDKWFPKNKGFGMSNGDVYLAYNSKSLPVHKVGDYKFSIMPSKADFARIDQSQLNISPDAKVSINVHPDNYSFIIYQFYQKGKVDITPFGYICKPCAEHSMVIPTIHGHPHNSNMLMSGSRFSPPLSSSRLDFEPDGINSHLGSNFSPVGHNAVFDDKADFDHDIYTLVITENTKPVDRSDLIALDNIVKKISLDYLNRNIRIRIPSQFVPNKIKVIGYKPNKNMFVDKDGFSFINDLVLTGQPVNRPVDRSVDKSVNRPRAEPVATEARS